MKIGKCYRVNLWILVDENIWKFLLRYEFKWLAQRNTQQPIDITSTVNEFAIFAIGCNKDVYIKLNIGLDERQFIFFAKMFLNVNFEKLFVFDIGMSL